MGAQGSADLTDPQKPFSVFSANLCALIAEHPAGGENSKLTGLLCAAL